jgi:hypothetical protein
MRPSSAQQTEVFLRHARLHGHCAVLLSSLGGRRGEGLVRFTTYGPMLGKEHERDLCPPPARRSV